MPVASCADNRESFFEKRDGSFEVALTPRCQGESGPVACLSFKVAQVLREGEALLEGLSCLCPLSQVEVNFTLRAGKV